jgi:hypothetical protein
VVSPNAKTVNVARVVYSKKILFNVANKAILFDGKMMKLQFFWKSQKQIFTKQLNSFKNFSKNGG